MLAQTIHDISRMRAALYTRVMEKRPAGTTWLWWWKHSKNLVIHKPAFKPIYGWHQGNRVRFDTSLDQAQYCDVIKDGTHIQLETINLTDPDAEGRVAKYFNFDPQYLTPAQRKKLMELRIITQRVTGLSTLRALEARGLAERRGFYLFRLTQAGQRAKRKIKEATLLNETTKTKDTKYA